MRIDASALAEAVVTSPAVVVLSPSRMFTTTSLMVRDFGCLKNVDVALTPLHAFIGPNDSGKSSLLRAIQWACYAASDERQHTPDYRVPSQVENGTRVRLALSNGGVVDVVKGPGPATSTTGLSMPTLMRLAPDALREPSSVIVDGQPTRFFDERGTGLASVYDALTHRNFAAFSRVRDQLLALFPTVAEIGFPPQTSQARTVRMTLKGGRVVSANGMSEGLLYFLALAALPHIEAGPFVLVEEPENGLHPARIREVVRVLRELSKTTQVILATHSPLVVNELENDEVTVVTRDPEEGTRVVPISQTPNFEARSRVYKLGELWLAYADGESEAPLLEGGPRE